VDVLTFNLRYREEDGDHQLARILILAENLTGIKQPDQNETGSALLPGSTTVMKESQSMVPSWMAG